MRSTDADEVPHAYHLPHHIPIAVYEERAEAASLSDALLQRTSGGHRRTQAHLRAAHVEVDCVTPPIDVESRLHERLGVVRTELRNERFVLYAVSDALHCTSRCDEPQARSRSRSCDTLRSPESSCCATSGCNTSVCCTCVRAYATAECCGRPESALRDVDDRSKDRRSGPLALRCGGGYRVPCGRIRIPEACRALREVSLAYRTSSSVPEG